MSMKTDPGGRHRFDSHCPSGLRELFRDPDYACRRIGEPQHAKVTTSRTTPPMLLAGEFVRSFQIKTYVIRGDWIRTSDLMTPSSDDQASGRPKNAFIANKARTKPPVKDKTDKSGQLGRQSGRVLVAGFLGRITYRSLSATPQSGSRHPLISASQPARAASGELKRWDGGCKPPARFQRLQQLR